MQKNIFTNNNTQLKKELDTILKTNDKAYISKPLQKVDEERNISVAEFKKCYVDNKRPVVLKGVLNGSSTFEKWGFDFFAQHYGQTEVVSNLYDVHNTAQVSLTALIDTITAGSSSHPVYLQEWWFQSHHPELLDDIEVPDFFADDKNAEVFGYMNHTLWIGQKSSYTPIHQDTVHANVWTAQLRGHKRWTLIDPSAVLHKTASEEPDIENFFERSMPMIYETVLEESDILYMPHKWWHRAETLSNAISLNTFYITPEILQSYIRDVLSIPLAASLNRDLLQDMDPMRYNICLQRADILAKNMGLNAGNILNIDMSGAARSGIYNAKKANG